MYYRKITSIRILFYSMAVLLFGMLSSCDEDPIVEPDLKSSTFSYQFHNGQAVPSAPYLGLHNSSLSATLALEELANGNTKVTVSIQNTIDGETYHTHAHDAADPANTTNGTPYIEAPNSDIFAQAIMGNGGSVSKSQESNKSYDELTSSYEGFFVVHDPLQDLSTTEISTFILLGSFAREQAEVNYSTSTFQYDFNTGQLVPDFAYIGTHPTTLSAQIKVDQLSDENSRITVLLMNTIDGEMYHTHAHDAADPSTTPNGTPYIESPNSDIFAAPIAGNGGSAGKALISTLSYDSIVSDYEGFFVVHDPLQGISTTDPTTYVLLGLFAR